MSDVDVWYSPGPGADSVRIHAPFACCRGVDSLLLPPLSWPATREAAKLPWPARAVDAIGGSPSQRRSEALGLFCAASRFFAIASASEASASLEDAVSPVSFR